VHDAQYSLAEYPAHVGWGHSALEHTLAFARLADVRHLVTFHHDPGHSDADIDSMTAEALEFAQPSFEVTSGGEGAVFKVVAEEVQPLVGGARWSSHGRRRLGTVVSAPATGGEPARELLRPVDDVVGHTWS
jgi:hypothetical protein